MTATTTTPHAESEKTRRAYRDELDLRVGSTPAGHGRPILVTGAHRSGTTWVGRMLAAAPGVGLIHEPFNPLTPRGTSAVRFDRFFRYVCDENEAFYRAPFERMLAFHYNLRDQLPEVRSAVELARTARDLVAFTRARRTHARPLLKDPIAVFSSEWIASRFGAEVIMLVRHPAAFASSLKKYNWTHHFEHFLDQPLLMRDHLEPFEREIRDFARRPRDVVEQATLLWRMIYQTVLTFRDRHPDWVFVRHEDLSRDPTPGFEALYARLGLTMTAKARRAIDVSSGSGNPTELRHLHDVRLDSRASVKSWKRRLSEREIEIVRAGTERVSAVFYDDADW